LVVSDVSASVQVQSSVSTHLRSEYETSSISDWWVLVLDNDLEVGDLHDGPSLVGTVVAVPPDDMSVVMVMSSMNIKALSSIVSDVSSRSTINSDLLLDLSSPLSDDSWSSDVEFLTGLVGDTESSLEESSDGSSSGIEHPLSSFSDLVVSSVMLDIEVVDSQSELVSTDVLVPEEVLTARHLGSDIELNTVSQWLSVSWLL